MSQVVVHPADPDLRAAARQRLEARAASRRFLALWAVLAVLFVGIWAVSTPGGYFWPAWPILGVGIGVGASFLASHGARWISEDRVDAEVARMRA